MFRVWLGRLMAWLGMFKFVLGRFSREDTMVVGNNISRLGVFGVWLGRLMAWLGSMAWNVQIPLGRFTFGFESEG